MKFFSIIYICFLFTAAKAQSTIGLIQYNTPSTDGYLLFAPITSTQTYLINKCGKKVKEWSSSYKPGLSVSLLPNSDLFRTGTASSSYFGTGGGKGGVLQRFDWDGKLTWQYTISDSMQNQHHEAIVLPNGNILAIVWDRKSSTEAVANGKKPNVMSGITNGQLWSEKIVEIKPSGTNGGTVVWEWKVFDHLVQDFDNTKSNYNTIDQHPELININYVSGPPTSSDWIHMNAIDYNAATDQILVSTHNLEEIWIIDHSTTTAQAASHKGGIANKGGDLLYRWGNPQVYNRGTASDKKLYKQHHAHWIQNGLPNAGKILIFNNGVNRPGGNASSVDMIETPIDGSNNYPIGASAAYLPTSLYWTYKDQTPANFYATNISGAFALPNGSFMITDGNLGKAFEIDSTKKTVWQYINPVNSAGAQTQGSTITANTVFRFQFYQPSYAAFATHTLTAGSEIELNPTSPSLCLFAGIDPINPTDLYIYPNPTNSELNIAYTQKNPFTNIELINALGQIVYSSQVKKSDSHTQISVTDFESGIYILRMVDGDKVASSKILLHH